MRSRIAGFVTATVAISALAACGGSGDSPAATPPATAPAGVADWPTYHGSVARGGLSTTMPAVSGPMRRTQALRLDGAVYASPLVVHGLTIVATENNSVYAFDQSYHQVWKRNLGSPSPQSERQCGDIDPLGITGTPIYDAATDRVYVAPELGGPPRHVLFALDRATGAVAWSRGVDLPGVTARDMQQRGALAIARGRVWVSFGGQAGDCGDYKGRVVGVPLNGGSDLVFYSPATARGAGIWNPAGPTVDAAGNLLVVDGNGAASPGDPYDYSNSVLKLDGSARLLDSFAPTDWAARNPTDVDLGSQGVALVGGAWAVFGDKSGRVYVLRQDHLGGIGGQVDVQDICRSFGGAAVDGNVVYLPCTDGVRAVQVDRTGHLHPLWHAADSVDGSPVVGGGRVWALDTGAGVLHALDPATGKSLDDTTVGAANRFATPALYGADVIVPTLTGIAVVRTS